MASGDSERAIDEWQPVNGALAVPLAETDADQGLQALKEVQSAGLLLDTASEATIRRRADLAIMPVGRSRILREGNETCGY